MALLPCPECKSDISEKAESCPHCGSKLSGICPECNSFREPLAETCGKCGFPFPATSKSKSKVRNFGKAADGQGKLWFIFWVYVCYPLGFLYTATVALAVPAAWFFAAVLAIVAVGLGKRQLWAWQANLLVLFGNYGQLFLPVVRETMPEDQWVLSLILGAGFLIANSFYWTKRKSWFKHDPGKMLIWQDSRQGKSADDRNENQQIPLPQGADFPKKGAEPRSKASLAQRMSSGSIDGCLIWFFGAIIIAMVFYAIFIAVGVSRQ